MKASKRKHSSSESESEDEEVQSVPTKKTKTVFKFLNLNNELYKVGDFVQVNGANDEEHVCKINEIYKSTKPMMRISWMYKPSEVFETKMPFIGDGELFLTDHEQEIRIETIFGKAKVLTFEEYFTLDEVEDDVYYYRALFHHKTKQLEPPIEEWRKVCLCKSIINPDVAYIECDKCKMYVHRKCVGLKEDDPIDNCPICHQ